MRRHLILWLLIVALPVQGWAAFAHAGCQSAPQALAALAAMPHDAMAGHAQPADHHAHGTPAQDSSCSGACHACCLAPSMTPPQARVPGAPAAGQVLAAWRPSALPEAPAARLERPPRPTLAA